MRILITGILGFIGSHCGRLLSKDHQVTGLDKGGDTRNNLRIRDYARNINLVYADMSRDISGVLENIDVVINFAANTFVDHSIKDPSVFVKNNIIGTFNLLEQARKYPVKKFIHISTDEVYGSIYQGLFKESDILKPANPYSATKASADMLCLAYHNTYKIPIVIVRCENNYGIWQHQQKAIPAFINRALNNQNIILYGDGKHKRMWLRVEDFCTAIEILIHKSKIGEIYNVGSEDEYENIEIAMRILAALDKPTDSIEYIPDEIARPGHDRRYGIDSLRIRNLGWTQRYNLQNSLPEIVDWYKKHARLWYGN